MTKTVSQRYFNPRSPCGERPAVGVEEHDRGDFNPRSPCGERRVLAALGATATAFQSTLPVRGATRVGVRRPSRVCISIHAPRAGSDHTAFVHGMQVPISIHAPRAGSDEGAQCFRSRGLISIHAPRAGSDQHASRREPVVSDFNPRSPCGERRAAGRVGDSAAAISIHAPRAGSDQCGPGVVEGAAISIHAPRAGSDFFLSPG